MSQTRQNNSKPISRRCDGGDGVVHLPIAQGAEGVAPSIRPSRMGRRRAMVLATVQLVMVAHIVQWRLSGSTTTPIEPSESMEFVKRGVVNAGLIFFAIALLSTLLLGRWFCGWGCHLVMLQDGCGWLMKQIGIRPRPFRSRLLVWVPLILALYMFVWPLAYRWGVAPLAGTTAQLPEWQLQTNLTTPEFWSTFAGVAVAIPFLFVCGFATVYFLGAKGFCTYGCPYGGFFAPLDRLAPARIRVTDACEHCGHCTAACTSNVRVHEEVRDFGMVVDPGCMKCLDCVSVCPNNALYFGFGPISLAAPPRVSAPAKRRYDLTWGEEYLCAVAFAAFFFAFRGLYSMIPMLFAVGIAGCGTFILWKAWRLLGDRDSRFHRFQLRRGGRIAASGVAWLVMAGLFIAITLHSAIIQYHAWQGMRLASLIPISTEAVFRGSLGVDPATSRCIELAKAHLSKADIWREGGLGLLPDVDLPVALARLNLIQGNWPECERQLKRGIALTGATDILSRDLARVMLEYRAPVAAGAVREKTRAAPPVVESPGGRYIAPRKSMGRLDGAVEHLRETLAAHPSLDLTRELFAQLLTSLGRMEDAQRVRDEAPTK